MILEEVENRPSRAFVRRSKTCSCKQRHKRHICELRAKGRTHEIHKLTRNPSVACGICGEPADSDEDVCLPVPLFI